MYILFDALSLVAGIPTAPGHRPARPAQETPRPASAFKRHTAAAGRFVRSILADIGGAVPLHAFEGLRRWRRRSKAIAELGALNSHILRDIGVSRGSIREVVDAMLQAETRLRTW